MASSPADLVRPCITWMDNRSFPWLHVILHFPCRGAAWKMSSQWQLSIAEIRCWPGGLRSRIGGSHIIVLCGRQTLYRYSVGCIYSMCCLQYQGEYGVDYYTYYSIFIQRDATYYGPRCSHVLHPNYVTSS